MGLLHTDCPKERRLRAEPAPLRSQAQETRAAASAAEQQDSTLAAAPEAEQQGSTMTAAPGREAEPEAWAGCKQGQEEVVGGNPEERPGRRREGPPVN